MPPQLQCSIKIDETSLKDEKFSFTPVIWGLLRALTFFLMWQKSCAIEQILDFCWSDGAAKLPVQEIVQQRELDGIVFHDEIDSDEIPDLYNQCHVGIVALDPRHKSTTSLENFDLHAKRTSGFSNH